LANGRYCAVDGSPLTAAGVNPPAIARATSPDVLDGLGLRRIVDSFGAL